MKTTTIIAAILASLLFFGCQKDSGDRIITVDIDGQLSINKIDKKALARTKLLHTLRLDIPERSDLDLSILKNIEEIRYLEVLGGSVNFHHLESLRHIENFKIESYSGSEIRLPSLRTMDNMSYNILRKDQNLPNISFPLLESVSDFIYIKSYNSHKRIKDFTFDLPSLVQCKRLVLSDLECNMDLRLPSIKSIGVFHLAYTSLKNTISESLRIDHEIEFSAADGSDLPDLQWLENSFGSTKHYSFKNINPSDLCIMKPVAQTEPLRIDVFFERNKYNGAKIVELCK